MTPSCFQRSGASNEPSAVHHDRVLAFDQHLITLNVLRDLLRDAPCEVLIATGQATSGRKRVERLFAPTGDGRALALCSDAMNEGLNLQGAAAIVHLDLPTTLRVAEQRVGRVDRMDTPHSEIEAWWPRDGQAFATRANERLARRAHESEALLGSNLPIPQLVDELLENPRDEIVDVELFQREVEQLMARPADELFDAVEPVRRLAFGSDALITEVEYESYRSVTTRVLARVAPVASRSPWAFFAVRSSWHGAPRWLFVDPVASDCRTDMSEIADQLRLRLSERPPNQQLDEQAARWLDRSLELAAEAEIDLLPRRMQRALAQMRRVATEWQRRCQRDADEVTATRWAVLAAATAPASDAVSPDPFAVAERWLELIAPRLESFREANPRRRYVLLGDVTRSLIDYPLDIAVVERALSGVPESSPLAERVSACILGVPAAVEDADATVARKVQG